MTAEEKRTYEAMADSLFDAFNAAAGNPLPKVPVVMGSASMTRAAGYFEAYSSPERTKFRTAKITDGIGRTLYAHIRLSPAWIDRGYDHDVLTETLKHEMAHLWELVTRGVVNYGHGVLFRKYCLRLGCNPARYHSIGTAAPDGQYVYYCPNCGEITRYKRFVSSDSDGGICAECSIALKYAVNKQFIGKADVLKSIHIVRALDKALYADESYSKAASEEGK